jgi:GNAT superfamily N-acetyltransferase
VPELIVRPAEPEEVPALNALRHGVFADEQGIPAELIIDEHDASAIQVVALRDGALVGTGRLVVTGSAGKIGRLATSPADRASGVGRAVMIELERQGRARGLTEIRLHALDSARSFYDRIGYEPYGEVFLEGGREHVAMRKPLPVRRPAADTDSAALIDLIGGCFAEYPGCVLAVDEEEPWLRRPASGYPGQLWVVELDGPVVACVGYKPHGSELKNLYVSAKARRGGLGSWLVGVVEEAARAGGATSIRLWSDSRFLDAHRLYGRLGYERTGATRELHDLSDTTEYEFARPL